MLTCDVCEEQDFAALLSAAKEQNKDALEHLVTMYMPIITKTSLMGGRIDEDLQQLLITTVILCVYHFDIR